ncbi:unnamed protein product [Amoebophrya sp. A25]|nr:unnamed protein product [Amoebophrya sp. A25]|eukprot:GSA25T00020001001.1
MVDSSTGLFEVSRGVFVKLELLAIFAEGDHMDVPGDFFTHFFHDRDATSDEGYKRRNCFFSLRDLLATSRAGHKFYGGSYESDNVSGELAWVNQRYMPAGIAWSQVRYARTWDPLHCVAAHANSSFGLPQEFSLNRWANRHAQEQATRRWRVEERTQQVWQRLAMSNKDYGSGKHGGNIVLDGKITLTAKRHEEFKRLFHSLSWSSSSSLHEEDADESDAAKMDYFLGFDLWNARRRGNATQRIDYEQITEALKSSTNIVRD